ncbi:MAG: XrtA/PEP-CTERM system TPR-repeat protein PrsT [Glaciecola sp.]
MKKLHVSAKYPSSSMRNTLLALVVAAGLSGCAEKTPEEFVAEAQTFIEQGDNNAAVVALKNAIQKQPRNADYRFMLGRLYVEQKNFESAEKELSRALELGYAPSETIPLLSQALQRTGANVALADIDTANVELSPEQTLEVGFRKLQSLMQLNKTLEAKSLITDLLIINADTVYADLVQGYRLVQDRQFEEALTLAKAAYEQAPENRDVLNFTARLYMINNMPSEAANIYEDYIKVAPEDLESKFSLASMLVEQREVARAEVYIDELLAISQSNPLLNQLKGVVRAADEDYENAKLYSEKAIAAGRPDPTLRLVAGLSSYQLNDFEAAVGHLSLIASLLPDNHPGLRILAASQLQANMGDDANEILGRINDVSQDDATLFSKAGYELIRSGNTQAAKQIIEQADKISESAEDLTRLGILKLSINDIEGLVDLESAVSKAPESARAKTTLASAYLSTDQFDKAMALAKEWQQESSEDVEAYLLEAEVLMRQQKYAAAAEVLSTATNINDNSTLVDVSKIRLDLRMQNYDEALAKTTELLDKEPSNLSALASFVALQNQRGNSEAALQRVNKALVDAPDNTSIKLLNARVNLAFNKLPEAISALSTITPDRSAPMPYWPLQGMALLRNNAVDEALSHYQTWASLYPNQQNSVVGQLVIHDAKREYEKGAQVAQDYLSQRSSPEVNIMLSYFKVMSGDVESAKRIYDGIPSDYMALPFLRGVKARIAIREGRAAEVVEDALVAYDANKNTNNLVVLTSTLEAAGQRDAAFKAISSHVEARPNDMAAVMMLAERQLATKPADAIASYEKVLAVLPDNFVVLNNIAYLEMQAGNLERASEYGGRAYEMQPDNAATADTYAQILIRQGKLEDAVKTYNRVMTDDVKNEEIFLNYLEALWMNGNGILAERRMDDLPLSQAGSIARLNELKAKYM